MAGFLNLDFFSGCFTIGQELAFTGFSAIQSFNQSQVGIVGIQTLKSLGKLFHLYQEKPHYPLRQQVVVCASEIEDLENFPHSIYRIKQVAYFCFFMEILKIVTYLPLPALSLLGLGASNLGVMANVFCLAGSVLMVRVEISSKEALGSDLWKKSGKWISASNYASTATYVALKIFRGCFAPITIPILENLTFASGSLSLAITAVNTTFYLIDNRKEIQIKCQLVSSKIVRYALLKRTSNFY